MSVSPIAIVDAVADDILALNLATFKRVRRYAPPIIHPPEQLPELDIYAEPVRFRILSGAAGLVSYQRVTPIVIAWVAWNSQGAELGGVGDQATVQQLDTAAQPLVDHVANYASGMPTLGPEVVGTLDTAGVIVTEGGAWVFKVTLDVEEAA